MPDLPARFGQIDIYLFDQLLRGRIHPGLRVLDAGCGEGRNLVYLLREGYEVLAVDQDPAAIERVRALAAELAPGSPPGQLRAEPLERMSFDDAVVDVVVANAVLHFARDHDHFRAMVDECWRVLAPGGLLFCRLASTIGLAPGRFQALGEGRFVQPDGSQRYLVDEATLLRLTERLGGELADPIKTTVVQGLRSMTTWVCRKAPARP